MLKSIQRYVGLLADLLRQPRLGRPPTLYAKRLVIFLKAVTAAYYLKDTDVQFLHTHFAWLPGAATWVCARLLDLPFSVTVHAYDIYSSNDLLPLVSRNANRIVAISDYNRQQVAALGTCPENTISIVHCGVNLAHIEQELQAKTERPANESVKILSVGSLLAKKGHAHLIAACHLLKRRGIDFTCTIIGDGPDEPALRQKIQVCGLENKVKLLGARPHPEVLAAYRRHDLFVLASVVTPLGDRDGIPVALMEAGAMGLPLISTEVSGIPELVRHDQTGWLVPPGNEAALADAITALAADPALRARLGKNAQALVKAQYAIENSAQRLVSLFQSTHQQWQDSREAAISTKMNS